VGLGGVALVGFVAFAPSGKEKKAPVKETWYMK
jgi:hypothetical protein